MYVILWTHKPGVEPVPVLRFDAPDPDAAQLTAADVIPKSERRKCRVVQEEQ